MDKVGFFSADFRDGRVHIGGKTYPAGTFATHLLNQYYVNDTAARLSVFIQSNWRVAEKLSIGFLDPEDYIKAGEEIQHILKTLPKLQPFTMLPIDDERNRTAELFSEENRKQISEYFHRRAKVELTDDNEAALNLLPKEYNREFFKTAEKLIADVTTTLAFYESIGNDITDAFQKLRKFASCVDEAARLDEAHLLPIAFEVFGQQPFPIKSEYVPVRKTRNSKDFVTARRLYFESYYSFVITDFFEGLHAGHYPRQCGICKKYFLMQSAIRQKYCSGYAPVLLKGKPITCRKLAARQKRKETAEANPIIRIYKNRCSVIRVEKLRGTITEPLSDAALSLAYEHMKRANTDDKYAVTQYEADMSHDKLYKDAKLR